ncbi:hypothetical protein J8F10_17815 [Gemmata sp. G18]|uniref:Uncharacterized protein n=1 Tax=Gemmata palustris TaxID=2822762 RepID=A0ABS5BUZ7_9BACT|nr:hypothetical protein [Gemmata palustris]MBP3957125.1 hypothetical protein [Gemmata palustris]
MYSVVLMVAATSGGDMASFGGKDKAGCHGTVVSAGCTGCTGTSASCHGGGFLGLRNGGGLFSHKSGCHGSSCHGTPTGCTGYTPAPAPAPVVVAAPAGCTGSGYSYAGCHGSSCHGGGFLGLRSGGGLFNKKSGCHGSCHGG